MKAKILLVTLYVIVTNLFNSCIEHSNLRSGSNASEISDESPMAMMLETTLKGVNDTVLIAIYGKELQTSQLLKEFYALNNNYPVWTTGMEPNRFARELLRVFAKAGYYGLDTAFYQFTNLESLYYKLKDKEYPETNQKALEFELMMTHNCFKMMSHLSRGVLNPDNTIYGHVPEKFPMEFAEKLSEFIHTDRLTEGITELQPKSYEYKRLQKGLVAFLDQNNLSDNKYQVPDPLKDSLQAYEKAREILIDLNYLQPDMNPDDQFLLAAERYRKRGPAMQEYADHIFIKNKSNKKLIAALKEFQKDHGLSPDGRIGTNTVNALQLSKRDRFEQIAINLERLRWEKNRPAKYVYVNVPSYKLRVFADHNIVKTFNIVVGAPHSQTMLMNSKIEYFTTNPEWYVPHSISSKELLPKIKNDSTYLSRHNYKIFDKNRQLMGSVDWSAVERENFGFYLQQAAGSGNAMGKVKFYFENPYILMIHDTNDKSKFSKDIRAFSHGCMRVQDPDEFTKTMLRIDNSQLADSIDTWFTNGTRKKIDFKEHIPLFVRYVSCEADNTGRITMYPDIYGKDAPLRKQFFMTKKL